MLGVRGGPETLPLLLWVVGGPPPRCCCCEVFWVPAPGCTGTQHPPPLGGSGPHRTPHINIYIYILSSKNTLTTCFECVYPNVCLSVCEVFGQRFRSISTTCFCLVLNTPTSPVPRIKTHMPACPSEMSLWVARPLTFPAPFSHPSGAVPVHVLSTCDCVSGQCFPHASHFLAKRKTDKNNLTMYFRAKYI